MSARRQVCGTASRARYIRMDASVRDAVRMLSDPEVDALVVVEGSCDDKGAFIGILTEREIFKAMADRGLDVLDHLAWMVASETVVSVDVRTTPADRLQAFCTHKTNHIVIMDGLCLHSIQSIWDCVATSSGHAAAA